MLGISPLDDVARPARTLEVPERKSKVVPDAEVSQDSQLHGETGAKECGLDLSGHLLALPNSSEIDERTQNQVPVERQLFELQQRSEMQTVLGGSHRYGIARQGRLWVPANRVEPADDHLLLRDEAIVEGVLSLEER